MTTHLSLYGRSHCLQTPPEFWSRVGVRHPHRVATHVENLEKSRNLRVVREKSRKMCSCMHEIWQIGFQENH